MSASSWLFPCATARGVRVISPGRLRRAAQAQRRKRQWTRLLRAQGM